MTSRAVLYARFSSDLQRDASIEDQLRSCRDYAARKGFAVTEEYSDRAVSGASLVRSSIQKLLEDARGGGFDVVIAEALDRHAFAPLAVDLLDLEPETVAHVDP